MTAMRFSGKTAVVTGAAAGIGRGIAGVLAAEGADLLLVDRDPAVRRVADELGAAHLCADVGAPDTAAQAVRATLDRYGRLDVLVNNAAVLRTGLLHEFALEDWEQVLRVNLTGPYLMMRAAIPAMLDSGGAIVNIASISTFAVLPEHAAYCASKGALLQLSRQAALDYARFGIRVNCVAPGTVDTPLLQGFLAGSRDPQRARQGFVDRHPLGRLGTPEDVGRAVAYLASADAGFVTGACLSVDGGYLLT